MRKFMFFLLVLEGGIVLSAYAKASECYEPSVYVELKKLTPSYATKPHPELVKLCQGDKNVQGCTVAEYGCSYRIYLNKKRCKELKFECYPRNFKVYIVDDYPEGTCEYNAIRKHENLHVSAIQNFPKESVEKYLNQCIEEEIKKKQMRDGKEIYIKCAEKTTSWINQKRDEKNRELDSYKKYDPYYFSNCTNWKMDPFEIKMHLNTKKD